jgi:hypothetical protein
MCLHTRKKRKSPFYIEERDAGKLVNIVDVFVELSPDAIVASLSLPQSPPFV